MIINTNGRRAMRDRHRYRYMARLHAPIGVMIGGRMAAALDRSAERKATSQTESKAKRTMCPAPILYNHISPPPFGIIVVNRRSFVCGRAYPIGSISASTSAAITFCTDDDFQFDLPNPKTADALSLCCIAYSIKSHHSIIVIVCADPPRMVAIVKPQLRENSGTSGEISKVGPWPERRFTTSRKRACLLPIPIIYRCRRQTYTNDFVDSHRSMLLNYPNGICPVQEVTVTLTSMMLSFKEVAVPSFAENQDDEQHTFAVLSDVAVGRADS